LTDELSCLVRPETMRRAGTARAFAFDWHFRQQGFELVP
jgi:hypothetical protein